MNWEDSDIVKEYKKKIVGILKECGRQEVKEDENWNWLEHLLLKSGLMKEYPTLSLAFKCMYNERMTYDEKIEILENLYDDAFIKKEE